MLPLSIHHTTAARGLGALSSVAVLTAALLLGGCSRLDEPPATEESGSTAASDTDEAVNTLLQAGLDQIAAGEDQQATATFENVLTLDPDNAYALFDLGVLAERAAEPDAALAYYDRALLSDADFTPALFNKAILLEPSDLEESVEIYRRVVALDDQKASAMMRLGFALVHLGESEEGEVFLGRGVRLDPSMAEVEAPRYE